ncbi:hypothetical protein ACFWH7_04450 [Cellulosimicrobium cellulans]|uniref:hypothetical protein n=1 Tax=Cellulosimicrobium cellulans TaxID=1710 RepID=UPI00366889CB
MASEDETRQALLDAIHRIATDVDPTRNNATSLEARASAANNLAEAYAWLGSATQPH